jgi:hypothetical protein
MVQGVNGEVGNLARGTACDVNNRPAFFQLGAPAPTAEERPAFRVDPRRKILAGGTHDLAADFAVGMLLGVEIVERGDPGHQRMSHVGEHGHEAGVPEKDVGIESGVDERGNETASGWGLVEMAEGKLPGFPVGLDPGGLAIVDGRWQPVTRIEEGGRVCTSHGGQQQGKPDSLHQEDNVTWQQRSHRAKWPTLGLCERSVVSE